MVVVVVMVVAVVMTIVPVMAELVVFAVTVAVTAYASYDGRSAAAAAVHVDVSVAPGARMVWRRIVVVALNWDRVSARLTACRANVRGHDRLTRTATRHWLLGASDWRPVGGTRVVEPTREGIQQVESAAT